MARKHDSQLEGIRTKIATALEAVSGIDDPSIKGMAFQTILQFLLESHEAAVVKGNDDKGGLAAKIPEPVSAPKRPKGPKGRIEVLIEDGFFAEKRVIGDVKKELEAHGWFHTSDDLNPTLLRLVKERKLRRIKEPLAAGGSLVWRYSNR